MSGEEWSDAENDAIVADYFSMLADELASRAYNKAAHNRALQDLIGRSKGSIEYKHQNVSAVLKGLGETWIEGYKPAFNFQMSLVDSIERRLQQTDGWFPKTHVSRRLASDQDGIIGMGPSPNLQNSPPPDEREQMEALARRFDVATRDAANRALGKAGERCVLQFERSTLSSAGRADLAEQVRWVSQEEEMALGTTSLALRPTEGDDWSKLRRQMVGNARRSIFPKTS